MTANNLPSEDLNDLPDGSTGGLSFNEVKEILQQSAVSKRISVDLDDKQRLKALKDLDVLDKPSRRSFELLVDLANKLLGTPVSLISLVTDERQFFLSSSGLHEPWAGCRETPLSHSFCRHVVQRNEPLVVSDAEAHALVSANKAVDEIGVKAYLGLPVVLPDGSVIGSFCAIDSKPRIWTGDDLETIKKLVELTIVELTVKHEARQQQETLEHRLRQAQKMQAIGQLVGGVAHDFNNVLGAIQVQSELLQAQLKDQQVAPVKSIRETIRSAKAIVQQLLNWSRPADGKKSIVSLNEVVEESLPLISTYSTKFIEVVFQNVPCNDAILADPNQISQILLNLCGNAAYAMKNKAGKIFIEVSDFEVGDESESQFELGAGSFVKLRVSDDGCGIPKELLPRIHDPYFTTKPIGEGTGLGLWTVYGIVNEHNGKIDVESTPLEGTTVEIVFPASIDSPQPAEVKQIDKLVDASSQIRLLVVDDEPVIAQGLESLLNLHGYQAKGFTNGLEAMREFVADPGAFDIVITDQVMPEISGEKLIQEIKAIRPGIPIILCSGYSEAIQRTGKAAHLADAVCEKPNEFEDLVELIQQLTS